MPNLEVFEYRPAIDQSLLNSGTVIPSDLAWLANAVK